MNYASYYLGSKPIITRPHPESIQTEWVRNINWLPMPILTPLEDKAVGLLMITNDDSNYVSLSASGNYTVDWGDGSSENFTTGSVATHLYNYSNVSGEFSNSGTLVKQAIVTITPQPGNSLTGIDFAIPVTGLSSNFLRTWLEFAINCPQLSFINFQINTRGMGICENVSIYTHILTNFLNLFYGFSSLQNIVIGNTGLVTTFKNMFTNCYSLVSVPLFDTSSGTDFTTMFSGCYALKSIPLYDTSSGTNFTGIVTNCRSLVSVPLFDTSSGTDFTNMFSGCNSLVSVPLFDTSSGTDFRSMFTNCYSLVSVPLFDTSSGTDFKSMFFSANSLVSVPLFDTSSGTDFTNMFYGCYSLVSVPLFDTSSGTDFTSMFTNCYSLVSVPLFDTSSGTDFKSMFSGCNSLISIPLFNTSSVTSFNNTFFNCHSLVSVPLFDTSSVTDFNNTFYACYSLASIPPFNISSGTDFRGMFTNCYSLVSVPPFNTSSGITFTNMFINCYSLVSVPPLNTLSGTAFTNMFFNCHSLATSNLSGSKYTISYISCKLSKNALENIFNNTGSAVNSSQTITISSNIGVDTPITKSSIVVTGGSTTIPMSDTSSLSAGMQVTGTSTPLTTGRSVTFTDTGDLVTLLNHGLSEGDEVSFSTITSTTGIVVRKIYYVKYIDTSTFSLSLTPSGSLITLTNNGTGTIKYNTLIVSINPNISLTMSRPMAESSTTTLSFRQLKTYIPILKGYGVSG